MKAKSYLIARFYMSSILLLLLSHITNAQTTCTSIAGGSHFDPTAGNDKNLYNYLSSVAQIGPAGNVLSTPAAFPKDLTDFDGTTAGKFVAAQTLNPSKLDTNFVNVNDNMLVITVPGGYKPMFNYQVLGIKPGTKFTVKLKIYLLSKPTSPCALANPWLKNSIMYGVPDASGNGLKTREFATTDWGKSIDTLTFTGTLAANQSVINFQINSGYNIAGCTAIGISDIQVIACINPRIKSSQGTEICTGEQTLLELDKEYNATSYKWEKSTDAGTTWTTISTKKSVTSTMLTNAIFRATVDGVVTDNYAVTTMTCCTNASGQASSRETIFFDDFGHFTAPHTYVTSLGKTKTTPATDAPFRVPVDYTLPSHTYQATGAVNDGSYAVSSYMYKNVATWMGAIAEDHSQEPDGGYLLINVTASYKGAIYQRTIKDLCEGKELYFDAFVGNASGASPPILNLIIYAADGTTKLTESGVTTVTAGGWIRLKVPTFTLPAGQTSIVLKIMSTGENWSGGNDLVMDDIKIMACAPPSVDIFSDFPTLTKDMDVCTNPIVLEFTPSSLLTSFYGGSPSYLFQYRTTPIDLTDPSDYLNWIDLGAPQKTTKFTVTPSKTTGPYAGLLDGEKVYYRVVAASASILANAGGMFNEDDMCKNFSVSTPIETTVKCPKCTPIATTDVLTISTPDTAICPGKTAVLTSSKIHPSVAGAKYDFNWYKGTSTTGTPVKTTTNTTTATVFSDSYSLGATDRGTYILQVVDHDFPSSASCQYYDTITISDRVVPTYTITGGGEFCTGTTAPAVTLNFVGSKPFTFTWSDGTTTGSQTALAADSYTITPTATSTYTLTALSDKYCAGVATTTDKAVVTKNALPTVTATAQSTCLGQTATLTGAGAKTYAWSDAVVDGIAFKPAATKIYTVTGTDAKGCKDTATATVTVNPLPNVTTTDQTVCDKKSATLAGAGAKTYAWSDAVVDGVAFKPAATKEYTVTGTDANGCTATAKATVTVNPLPPVKADSKDVCVNKSTILTATGAQTYAWSDGITNGVSFTPSATKTYTVTGTDANGCIATTTATVTIKAALVIKADDKTVCAGKSATLSATGADTYVWSDGVIDGTPFIPTASKTYSVTGTDAGGCNAITTAKVTLNALPTVSATDQTICAGKTATLSGKGAITYKWSDGVVDGVAFSPTATKTYTLTGTDANGCENTIIASATVTVNAAPTVNATDVAVCKGKPATLTASGAKTYKWSDGVTDGVEFTPTATKTYTVTGTDANGCENSKTVIVTVNPLPTPAITSNAPSNTVCFGNTLTLNAGTYKTYAWSNLTNNATIDITQLQSNQTYSVTVTDNNNCENSATTTASVKANPVVDLGNDRSSCTGVTVTVQADAGMDSYKWSTGATSQKIDVTTEDDYTVTVTKDGCSASDKVHIKYSAIASIDLGADREICAGDSVLLTPGAGFETYTWSDNSNKPVLYAKTAGTYSVTVTSGNGNCVANDAVVVKVNALPTVNLTSTDSDNKICQGQSLDLDAGSFAKYTWQNMASTQKITVTASGDYAVTVTDAKGCKNSASETVVVNSQPTFTIQSDDADNIICNNNNKVTLSTAINYNGYKWLPGGETTATLEVSSVGTSNISLEVTDNNGCKNTDQVKVVVNPLPTPQIVATGGKTTVCFGETVVLKTATTYSSYAWSPTSSDASVTFSQAGRTAVSLTVTDANGCQNTATETVIINALPTPQISSDNGYSACEGTTITLSVPATYKTYNWTPSASGNSLAISSIGKTDVKLSVIDNNNCSVSTTASVTINANPQPKIVSSDNNNVVCQGETVTLNTQDAYPSYNWTSTLNANATKATSKSIQITEVGTTDVSLEVTDANGCKGTAISSVSVNKTPTPVITTDDADGDNIVCEGTKITLGTQEKYAKYAWNPTAKTETIVVSKLGTTNVTLVVEDGNGCQGNTSAILMINPLPIPQIISSDADNVACDGTTITLSTKDPYPNIKWNGTAAPSIDITATNTNIVLEVVDENGCSNTAKTSVTIHPNPTPTIKSTDANNDVCEGTAVTLSAGINYKTYSWNGSSSAPTFVVNTVGTNDVTLDVTDNNDCQGTATASVVVHPNPTPEFKNYKQSECEGNTVVLETKSNYNKYSWTYGSATSTNSSITIKDKGYTDVKLVVTDNNDCSATIPAQISINPKPVIAFPPKTAFCDFANLRASVTGVSVSDYRWSSGETTNPIKVTSSDTYTLTVTSTDGCENIASITITVSPTPHPKLPSDTAMCNGQAIRLKDQSADIADSYEWTLSGDPKVLSTNKECPNITQNGTYTLLAKIGTCQSSASTLVIAYALPKLDPITKNICFYQDNAIFTVNPLDFKEVNWYADNNGAEDLGNDFMHTITLQAGQNSSVQYAAVTDYNGCVSLLSAMSLNRLPEYTGLEIVGPATRCESQTSGTIYTIKGALETKDWSSSRKLEFSPDSVSTTVTSFNNGIDTLTFTTTDVDGCKYSIDKLVTTSPQPKANFEWAAQSSNMTIRYTNHSDSSFVPDINKTLANTYTWRFMNNTDSWLTSTKKEETITYPYGYHETHLIVKNEYGCIDSMVKTVFMDVITGLYTPNAFYPESQSGDLSVFGPKGMSLKEYEISIFDQWGNILWTSTKLIDGHPAEAWDGTSHGKILKSDTYIWRIKARFLDGSWWTDKNGSNNVSGNVLLIR